MLGVQFKYPDIRYFSQAMEIDDDEEKRLNWPSRSKPNTDDPSPIFAPASPLPPPPAPKFQTPTAAVAEVQQERNSPPSIAAPGTTQIAAPTPLVPAPAVAGSSGSKLGEERREKMQFLVSHFTEEQLDRYEVYRRSKFPKEAIKRMMQKITGNAVSQNVVIAMSGIAKVFVAEIVEEGLDVMNRRSETGPLEPKHLREAVRKLRLKGKIPRSKTRRFTPFS